MPWTRCWSTREQRGRQDSWWPRQELEAQQQDLGAQQGPEFWEGAHPQQALGVARSPRRGTRGHTLSTCRGPRLRSRVRAQAVAEPQHTEPARCPRKPPGRGHCLAAEQPGAPTPEPLPARARRAGLENWVRARLGRLPTPPKRAGEGRGFTPSTPWPALSSVNVSTGTHAGGVSGAGGVSRGPVTRPLGVPQPHRPLPG